MTIYADIDKILSWYYTESYSCVNIALFLAARDQLSVLSYRLAQECGDYEESAISFEGERKTKTERMTEEFLVLGDKMAYNRAELKAKIDNAELFLEEKKNEGAAKKTKMLLTQVNKVLDAMNQRISHLKDERKTSNRQGSDAQ